MIIFWTFVYVCCMFCVCFLYVFNMFCICLYMFLYVFILFYVLLCVCVFMCFLYVFMCFITKLQDFYSKTIPFQTWDVKIAIFLNENYTCSNLIRQTVNIPVGKQYFFKLDTSKCKYSLGKTIHVQTWYVKLLIFLKENYTCSNLIRQTVNIP